MPQPLPNDPILTLCVTLRNVMTLATEDETGTLHHNSIATVSTRIALTELKHPKGSTYFRTDDDTAKGFIKSTIRKKISKSWNMKYHLIKQQIKDNFLKCIGTKGPITRDTTSPNTTHLPITNIYDQPMSDTQINHYDYQPNHLCEGVLLSSGLASAWIRPITRE